LQARFNAVTASIILGFVEELWHIPLAFIPGMGGWEGRAIFIFFIYWIPISITRTWIFNNTNGSVLAAILFHTMGNTGGELIPVNVPELVPGGGWNPYLMLVLLPIVAVIVLAFGYKDLGREKKKQTQ